MATDRLTLGVAARLSRYLQVLTQAKKMGKSSISSQAISEYTNVNPTQIRRDLSGFGKFGKRGVGYDIDSLIEQIRKILRTSGQHNIALFGAGNLGQAIATSRRLRRPRLPHLGDLRRRSRPRGHRARRPPGAPLLRAATRSCDGRRRHGRRARRAGQRGPGGGRRPRRGRA